MLLLALLVSCPACFEPVKGCLDTEAVNFNATADDTCCCEYPQLYLDVEQYFGDKVFRQNSPFEISPGNWTSIQSAVFYASEFYAVQGGETFRVADTINLQTAPDGAEQNYVNDFQLIRRTPGSYAIGELRQPGTFSEAGFSLGLSDLANAVLPAKAPLGHPLRLQPEGMWDETTGFSFLKITFTRDTLPGSDTLALALGPPDFQKSALKFPGVFQHAPGYDFRLKLKIDFQKWFAGTDVSADGLPAIKARFVANLPGSFSVSQ